MKKPTTTCKKQVCKALPEKASRQVQFAEVSPTTIAASSRGGIQIRIGAADIHVLGNRKRGLSNHKRRHQSKALA